MLLLLLLCEPMAASLNLRHSSTCIISINGSTKRLLQQQQQQQQFCYSYFKPNFRCLINVDLRIRCSSPFLVSSSSNNLFLASKDEDDDDILSLLQVFFFYFYLFFFSPSAFFTFSHNSENKLQVPFFDFEMIFFFFFIWQFTGSPS